VSRTERPIDPGAGATRVTPPAGRGRGASRLEWAVLATALLSVLAAALLPFAPVSMSLPTVSWPQDAAAPVNTELQLTAEKPLGVSARFSCTALTTVRDDADGVLLSTVRPGLLSETQGLQVRVVGTDTLSVVSAQTELYRGQLPAGDCAYDLEMDEQSTRLLLDGQVLLDVPTTTPPAVAPLPGELPQLDRTVLPDVDVLATSLTALPGGTADDLGVTVQVDDQFSTSPTAVKWLITAVLVVSSLACLVLLARWDRSRRAAPAGATRDGAARRPWWRDLSVADLALVLLMVAWLFIAPTTDDDGYYAAMARNSVVNGYVGNYYQLFNQGYTPFTWFYQLLGYWDLIGHSPVVLRIPSFVAGLATYAMARVLVESVGMPPARNWLHRTGRHTVVALVFAAAWLPYCLGVRPEALVALFAVLSLGAVVLARKRSALSWYAASLLISGLAITCHPTGVVALAPWLISLPAMWPVVRGTTLVSTLARAAGVLAPAAIAAVPGFLDGSLNDFVRSNETFAVAPNAEWYDEVLRYGWLLGGGPMGSYAKRIGVLVAIVTLVWFVVLQLSAGGRRRRAFPPLMALTGWSLLLAFLLLWLTPSKWTHHFGAISGLTTVFVSCALLYGVRTAVAAQSGRRSLAPATVLAGLSLVVVFALSMRGPNRWAYSWMLGVPHPDLPPYVRQFTLDSPVLWLAMIVVIGVATALLLPRRRRSWGRVAGTAFPLAVVAFLGIGLLYLVGGFALATVRTTDTYSPWADAVQDPLGHDCGPQGALVGASPQTATTLPVATDAGSASTGFVAQGGYHPASPPGPTADARPTVWGSYPELGAEANTGELTTGWFTLPEAAPDLRLLVDASGRLGAGNRLTAEYGRLDGDAVTPVGSEGLDDGVDNPAWRQLTLVPSPGAQVVRLVAADAAVGNGGWLALTAPMQAQMQPLSQLVPDGAVVGVGWQFSFLFNCAQLPETVDGITEPSDYLFAFGQGGLGGLGDNVFTRPRAGLFHPTTRSSTLTQLATELPGQPELRDFRAYAVDNAYPDAAYDLDRVREVRWGWQTP
jgi:hypothetical protein